MKPPNLPAEFGGRVVRMEFALAKQFTGQRREKPPPCPVALVTMTAVRGGRGPHLALLREVFRRAGKKKAPGVSAKRLILLAILVGPE